MRKPGRGVQAAAAALAVAGVVMAVGDAGAQQSPGNEFPVGVDDNALRFKPDDITVSVGDTVVWDFTGATTAHNVVSENDVADDAQWKDFATTPSVGGQAEYTFTKVGEYTYVCDLHRIQGMAGKVTVVDAPVATPTRTVRPLTTATPAATAAVSPAPTVTTPAPFGTAAADKTAPVFSKVSAKRSGATGARVKWTLSESVSLTIRFVKSGSSRAVRTVRLQGRQGTSGVTVRSSRFKRGRYSVQLQARDAAGNRSTSRTTVRIGR